MIENKILKWSVILGIVIVLNLFFAYALKIVYKAPQWDNFCQKEQVVEKIDNQEACLEKEGQWNKNIYPVPSVEQTKTPAFREEGYCNLQFTCSKTFQEAQKQYAKKIFIALVILGTISIALSFFIASAEVVSMGFSLGGVFSFVVASMRYWQYAVDYLQVIILGLALFVLIWLGIKKFK